MLNSLQLKTYNRLLETLRGAHHVDIVVRKDGADHHFEADWLRERLEQPVATVQASGHIEITDEMKRRALRVMQEKTSTAWANNQLLGAAEVIECILEAAINGD